MDPQVTFLPSAEVLVKALVLISSAALATAPVSSMRILFCSHHPCVVGTAKRDAVWRVNVYQSIKIRIIYFVLSVFFLGGVTSAYFSFESCEVDDYITYGHIFKVLIMCFTIKVPDH